MKDHNYWRMIWHSATAVAGQYLTMGNVASPSCLEMRPTAGCQPKTGPADHTQPEAVSVPSLTVFDEQQPAPLWPLAHPGRRPHCARTGRDLGLRYYLRTSGRRLHLWRSPSISPPFITATRGTNTPRRSMSNYCYLASLVLVYRIAS